MESSFEHEKLANTEAVKDGREEMMIRMKKASVYARMEANHVLVSTMLVQATDGLVVTTV